MQAFIDIGSTLIDGPPVGPARWLCAELAIVPSNLARLTNLLFTTEFTGADELASRIVKDFSTDPEWTRKQVSALWDAQRVDAYCLEGAKEMLHRLEYAGIGIAYISNIWQPFFEGFERCLPRWAERYPCFLSYRLGISKPSIEIYRKALKATGCAPERAIMIGDTYENDIAPANELGMNTIWLLHRPLKERKDLVGVLNGDLPRPDLTLESVGELRADHLTGLVP